jgi:AraC-like DNA-binding protein
MRYMERRLSEPISISEVAAAVNLSASYFAHLFRDQAGVTPMQYVQRLRLEAARLLLERTSCAVREVMLQVGYRDPSHFSREFRRQHGASPRRWRTAQRSGSRVPPSISTRAEVSTLEGI